MMQRNLRWAVQLDNEFDPGGYGYFVYSLNQPTQKEALEAIALLTSGRQQIELLTRTLHDVLVKDGVINPEMPFTAIEMICIAEGYADVEIK